MNFAGDGRTYDEEGHEAGRTPCPWRNSSRPPSEQDVKFVACTLSMDILGFKEEELIDGLEFAGVTAYLGEADEANVNMFI